MNTSDPASHANANDVGMIHPDQGHYITLRRDGIIDLFVDSATGIQLNPDKGTVVGGQQVVLWGPKVQLKCDTLTWRGFELNPELLDPNITIPTLQLTYQNNFPYQRVVREVPLFLAPPGVRLISTELENVLFNDLGMEVE